MKLEILTTFECKKDFLFLSVDNATFADSTDDTAILTDLKIEITNTELTLTDSEFNAWSYPLKSVTCFTLTKSDTSEMVQILNGRTLQLLNITEDF